MNRVPPALSEQMGAAEDSGVVFLLSPHFALSSTFAQPRPFPFIFPLGCGKQMPSKGLCLCQ